MDSLTSKLDHININRSICNLNLSEFNKINNTNYIINLISKKVKKDFLKKKIFVLKVIQITQNFLANKKKIQKQIIMKEKNLILRRVKKDLKIEIDLNHLNLKNIIEVEIIFFFSFLF